MGRLAVSAELLKLARVLGVEVSTLEALRVLDAPALRAFRERAQARLFDADEARLRRVAAASKLLPTPLIALIAEHVFGALLCARVAGLLAPDRAADVAQRLRSGFLADVTLEIDPRHVREVVAQLPVAKIVDVALELARRGEFVTLARFVDVVSPDRIRAVIEKLTDNAALLHVAFFVEDKARLEPLVGLLPESRLREIILIAADESRGLWPEALSLMSEVGPGLRQRLGDLAASLDDHVLLSMARSAQAQALWGAVLPVIAVMSPAHQQRLLRLPVMQDAAVLDAILRTADAEHLWEQLLPLVPLMDEHTRDRLAGMAEALGEATYGRIFAVVCQTAQWAPVLTLLLRMRDEAQARLLPLLRELTPDTARRIAQEADRLGLLDRLERCWTTLATRTRG